MEVDRQTFLLNRIGSFFSQTCEPAEANKGQILKSSRQNTCTVGEYLHSRRNYYSPPTAAAAAAAASSPTPPSPISRDCGAGRRRSRGARQCNTPAIATARFQSRATAIQ